MEKLQTPVSMVWDLESIFPGGSSSEQLQTHIAQLEQDIAALDAKLADAAAPANMEETTGYDEVIKSLQSMSARLSEAGSFVGCLTAQDQHDKKAIQLESKLHGMNAKYENLTTRFQNVLRLTDDQVWGKWLEREAVAGIAFVLNEKRQAARERLAPELESLAADLAVDGYHGWSQHYDTVVAKVTVPYTDKNGKTQELSVGQAANKLDDPDRELREELFPKWEHAWSEVADYAADTLNRLAGFRLKLYEKRGWEDVLKEPLAFNRMSQATLDKMWEVIVKHKPIFVEYLERKAKLLGIEKLSWADVDAPIGEATGKVTYEDAAKEIVEQFHKFNPKMADFATYAFNQRWIEAEDRPGKRPGGFCTSLQGSKQTRIFMTYGGTISNLSTLAHELGHAYHQHVMNDEEIFNQDYGMNVAETASTFAEMIVSDALVQKASSKEEKIALLADKIQRGVAFFMNIHARFLFETRFYEQRKSGMLDAEQLCTLMQEAQEEAFCGSLGVYHPHFWASKLHFYITGFPFYNFPYTFGYMFSTGIYALAVKEGQGFADKYDALLQDTGKMTVEELASKHLNVDLTQPDFWEGAMALVVDDVKQFLELTAE